MTDELRILVEIFSKFERCELQLCKNLINIFTKKHFSEKFPNNIDKTILKEFMKGVRENEKNNFDINKAEQKSNLNQYLDFFNQYKNTNSKDIASNAKILGDIDLLSDYCTNLNELALQNKLDYITLRQKELERTVEVLCRRKKNNVLLIGEPGVGKTAIAEALAIAITQKKVPKFLLDSVVYSLNLGSLLSGTKYRGDFEQKVRSMLEILKNNKNVIVFIDEIHNLIGAGATMSNSLDAGNLMKPSLANGEFRCIGATTFREYKSHFEKDLALVRRFQKINVLEPDKKSALKMLQTVKSYYEKHHNVKYTNSALESAINLSERYITNRHLPDKAIDLIDEAGARARIRNATEKKITLVSKDIETTIADKLDIPLADCVKDFSNIKYLRTLENKLKQYISGQDEVINLICNKIKMSYAGLNTSSKISCSFLFIGPKGVGKKLLARKLSEFCSMKYYQFEMSEFTDSTSINKLIGIAPGYAGFHQSGRLVEEVSKHPYSVLLFNNINQAHQSVMDLVAQILNEGYLIDNTGIKVSFLHSIVILTNDCSIDNTSVGFTDKKCQIIDKNNEYVKKYIQGNLLENINIVGFNPIASVAEKLVKQHLGLLSEQLCLKNISLIFDNDINQYILSKIKDRENIAKNIRNVIESQIKQNLTNEILFGRLKNGGTIKVSCCKENDISFKFLPGKKKNACNGSKPKLEEVDKNKAYA